ncbi:MAG TPA: hypothetical protein VK773_11250 [Acidimicrobiales bacterium]|jgi:hypothetical protein|nr:hypothetical protein [Acidimicrobiales bacterium]
MDETKPSSATEEEDQVEAGAPHTADRAPTEEEERLADESRSRYADEAESVSEHERAMGETGANEKGEGRIP